MPAAAGLHFLLHEGGSLSKPPIVLIHGEAGDHLSWPPELRCLPGVRTYTLDLPGHGRSAGPGLQSISGYAQSVINFIDAVSHSRAIIAGHSMGGAVALTMAIDYRSRVAGIILLASAARLPIASVILENAANPSTTPQAVQAFNATLFSPQAGPRLKEAVFRRLSATRSALLYGDLLACDTFDVTGQLASIQTPALVVCGTADRLTSMRYSEELASGIPGAALQTIDGAGHMVMLEQPRRLAGLLTVFLATIPYL